MYFFVKDNNMNKNIIDVLKTINKESALFKAIKKAYFDTIENIMLNTINDAEERPIIEFYNENDKWLPVAIQGLLNASKAVTNAKEISLVVQKEPGKFATDFAQTTELKISRLGQTDTVGQRAIETEVVMSPGSGPSAQRIGEILSIAFYGGELKVEKDNKNPIVFNARKGYNQAILNEASAKLNEYFIETHFKEIENDLTETLKDELKMFKK